jgi:hypothetical protein
MRCQNSGFHRKSHLTYKKWAGPPREETIKQTKKWSTIYLEKELEKCRKLVMHLLLNILPLARSFRNQIVQANSALI